MEKEDWNKETENMNDKEKMEYASQLWDPILQFAFDITLNPKKKIDNSPSFKEGIPELIPQQPGNFRCFE